MTTNSDSARCERCRRPLRAPRSVAAGIGDRCAAIRAALHGLTPGQQDRALTLARDGGAVPTARCGVVRSVSGDGRRTYLTTTRNCTCPWGLHVMRKPDMHRCYHVGAARLTLTPRRRPAGKPRSRTSLHVAERTRP